LPSHEFGLQQVYAFLRQRVKILSSLKKELFTLQM